MAEKLHYLEHVLLFNIIQLVFLFPCNKIYSIGTSGAPIPAVECVPFVLKLRDDRETGRNRQIVILIIIQKYT